MKVYEFGYEGKPFVLIIPGTVCTWDLYEDVAKNLSCDYRVGIVSFDGFDENEHSEFISVLDEVEKIEEYVLQHHDGRIHGVYGCSLGGTLMDMLAYRKNIHMDYGIVGSSDFDYATGLVAALETKIIGLCVYPMIRNGKIYGFFEKKLAAKASKEYVEAVKRMLGEGKKRPYISRRSVENQFGSDLREKLPEKLEVEGSEFHIMYAKKMGEEYEKRYHTYFANPKIHTYDLQHEELLLCYPDKWCDEMRKILK